MHVPHLIRLYSNPRTSSPQCCRRREQCKLRGKQKLGKQLFLSGVQGSSLSFNKVLTQLYDTSISDALTRQYLRCH